MDIPWNIERLRKDHDRSEFSCGQSTLDAFLKTLVSQYEKKRLGRTYVATKPLDATKSFSRYVLGFYTICSGSISISTLPESHRKQLPKHPVPTIHLGRLAVDQSVSGRGLGKLLLFDGLGRAFAASQEIGIFGVDVFAVDESAVGFYQRHGFNPLTDNPLHLFLPMKTIAKSFEIDSSGQSPLSD